MVTKFHVWMGHKSYQSRTSMRMCTCSRRPSKTCIFGLCSKKCNTMAFLTYVSNWYDETSVWQDEKARREGFVTFFPHFHCHFRIYNHAFKFKFRLFIFHPLFTDSKAAEIKKAVPDSLTRPQLPPSPFYFLQQQVQSVKQIKKNISFRNISFWAMWHLFLIVKVVFA